MRNSTGIWIATAVAGFALTSVMPSNAGAAGVPSGSGAAIYGAYGQSHDWDAPPPELDEVHRHGFHDGIEGARKDYDNHRRPDVHNREEFRHPNVPERDREAYRRGFERGYQVGVDHLYNGRR
jgi:ribosome modulation factor